ncbi:MAG: tetratricopeptide repeat protein, partial [Candidatus Marinimicrobia bacterium]|nr:tetratricopeptide repeat protein [Candidatus Neomarinimicrobiota bacterium]
DIGDLTPEKMKFYDDMFCPLVEKKRSSSSEILGEIGLTSSELAEEYTRVTGKTTNSKKILENYLEPLVDAGVLDSFVDDDKRNQNKYCKVGTITTQNISNLKSKIVEDSKSLELSVMSCLDLLVKSSIKDKKYNEALAYFDQAIQLKPNFEKAYFNRAGIKFETEDYTGSIEDLNKVIDMNNKYEKAYYNRAKSKYAVEDNEGALKDYRKVIELNPENAQAAVSQMQRIHLTEPPHVPHLADLPPTRRPLVVPPIHHRPPRLLGYPPVVPMPNPRPELIQRIAFTCSVAI